MELDEEPIDERARLVELARESLRGHLASAGLSPWEEGDRVWIGIDALWCRIHMGEPIQHPGLWLVPFWFELALEADGTETIRESLAGMGATLEEAAVRVSHDWVEAVLPPVRMMLDPGFTDERVRVMDVTSMDGETNETTAWRMYAGPPLLLGGHAEAVLEAVERRPPVTMVLDQITGWMHLRMRHWAKLLLTRIGGELQGEVMIDNEPDGEALEALKRFELPPVDGFVGFRQFVILHPDPDAPEADPETRARLEGLFDPTPSPPPSPESSRPWWKVW